MAADSIKKKKPAHKEPTTKNLTQVQCEFDANTKTLTNAGKNFTFMFNAKQIWICNWNFMQKKILNREKKTRLKIFVVQYFYLCTRSGSWLFKGIHGYTEVT